MICRSELLADLIEEGAAELPPFAEGLSEGEWHAKGPVNGTDRRSVGVVVHRVACMFAIEIEAAKVIAGGKAVRDVTREVVDEINAKHARENANLTKAAALKLLRCHSRGSKGGTRTH